jgi:signal transduction histidine kinase
MRKLFFSLALVALLINANAQHKRSDTLLMALKNAKTDTARLLAELNLGRHYYITYPDSGIVYAQRAYEIAQKNNWADAQALALKRMADSYGNIGDYVKSMQYYFKALRAYENANDLFGEESVYNNIGSTYLQKQDYKNALVNLYKAKKLANAYALSHKPDDNTRRFNTIVFLNLGEIYLGLKKVDSAEYYLNKSVSTGQQMENDETFEFKDNIELDLGQVAALKGDKQSALKYYRLGIATAVAAQDVDNISKGHLNIGKLYRQYKQQDSAEYYVRKALEVASSANFAQDVLDAGTVLYKYYDEDHNLPEAYKYYKITTTAKDSLYSQEKEKQLLSLDFDEKQRQQDIAAAREQYRTNVRMYSLVAVLVVFLLLAMVFWRNSNQRKKANQLLQKQKEEIQSTLAELKTTQAQLVQSAKMASLGELTAGIAHEIQNPLNFVNNFSDVSTELVDEMQAELKNGDKDEAIAISEDIKQNLEKIRHHGKCADFIVKGMLEHSRKSTGERQATNINVLADEFLKLSYHGLRAKDKSFNAELVTNFSDGLPKINVVQQDIGRVLINLFGNAFYAVNQKAKTTGNGYKPVVEVTTAQQNGSILISVKDNGTGIPENIREKIMQPFFTTKPTGEGTGLGLSLSYDIVVKGHGGTINVKSEEGSGSEFTISVPLN